MNGLDVGEVFVVYESAEEVALEVNVVNIDGLSPDAAEVEEDSAAKVGWVGVAEGLAFVHKEVAHVVDLFELHSVGDGGSNVEGLSKLVGDLAGLPVVERWEVRHLTINYNLNPI